MATESKVIMAKLDAISSQLEYIRTHIKDIDLVLTDDDLESLKEAEKDLQTGKTKRP